MFERGASLVFTTPEGDPIDWRQLARGRLKALLRRAGLPDVPGYSLRHAFVNTLIGQGLAVRDLMRLTGYTRLGGFLGHDGGSDAAR